jgi:RNA polymerase sigma-70 factor
LSPAVAHEDRLRALHREGTREHDDLGLAFPDFAAWVLERVRRRLPAASDLARLSVELERCGGADLHLACACDRGAPRAWEVLRARCTAPLLGLLRAQGAPPALAEELVVDVLGELCTPPVSGRDRTRIGAYDGRAGLLTWLSVIALRRLADRRRRDDAGRREAGPGEARADPARDPARRMIEDETARLFEEALRAAWARLDARERVAALCAYRDRLSQGEIAHLLGTTQSTVSRMLQGVLERLRAEVRARVGDEEGGGEERLWRRLGEVVAEHFAYSERRREQPAEEA